MFARAVISTNLEHWTDLEGEGVVLQLELEFGKVNCHAFLKIGNTSLGKRVLVS